MRFDIPVVGPGTLEAMREAGSRALALDGGKTLLIDKDEFLAGAERSGIVVWGMAPGADEAAVAKRFGVFGATLVTFFLAEMGDKTQVATVALGAKYDDLLAVVAGTTLGMMLANAPAVWLGKKFTKALPIKWVHGIAALLFIVMGILTLMI